MASVINDPKKLSATSLTLVVISSCIGMGIFFTPPEIARYLPSEKWIMIVWSIGLLYAASGAIVCSKLAQWFPGRAGIPFFLMNAYGNIISFLYGWTYLVFLVPGTIAAFAIGVINFVWPEGSLASQKIIAIGIVVIISAVNAAGLHPGNFLSSGLAWLKIAGLILIILAGFVYGSNEVDLSRGLPTGELPSPADLGLAFVGVIFSFSGIQYGTFIAPDINSIKHYVLRSFLTGILIVGVLYLLANISYLKILGVVGLKDSANSAFALIQYTGTAGRLVVTIVVVSVLGSLSAILLAAPRMLHAMGVDGFFFSAFLSGKQIQRKPFYASMILCVLCIAWIFFWGTFQRILFHLSMAECSFMTLAMFSLFIVKKKLHQSLHFSYIMFAVIHIFISLFIITILVVEKPLTLLLTSVVFLAGTFLFYVLNKRRREDQEN